ncbi:MAG: DUF3014 domain-containing protein [Burkholderiaceae bacterium]|jgi:hypothetical protein|nr:DUF3014 domain-containing protein [Burkholderiaceae bacterium]MCP5290713.1 DUF3014 domain-containing protein [Burkholderiaceae bacterium]
MTSRFLPWAAAAALVLGLLAFWLWPRPALPPAPAAPAAEPAGAAPTASAPPPPASTPSPATLPVDDTAVQAPPAPPTTVAPLAADDASVRQALTGLLGREAVLALLQTDGFAERVVATVDALPRGHAAPRLWPVHPAEGRFTVDGGRIAAANEQRYAPFVRMVERLDPAAAAGLYRRLQPQLQAAYENLGYPGRRFDDRLLEVVDHLLATPQPDSPPAVTLTEVKGPIAPERPWVRYEYADPALESRSAGQRILLRLGDAQRRSLIDWLRAFRAQVAAR